MDKWYLLLKAAVEGDREAGIEQSLALGYLKGGENEVGRLSNYGNLDSSQPTSAADNDRRAPPITHPFGQAILRRHGPAFRFCQERHTSSHPRVHTCHASEQINPTSKGDVQPEPKIGRCLLAMWTTGSESRLSWYMGGGCERLQVGLVAGCRETSVFSSAKRIGESNVNAIVRCLSWGAGSRHREETKENCANRGSSANSRVDRLFGPSPTISTGYSGVTDTTTNASVVRLYSLEQK